MIRTKRYIISTVKIIAVLIFYGFLIHTSFGQTLPIDQVRQLEENSTVQIEGVILNSPNERNLRFIQDSTAGIAIYSTDPVFNQNVRQGDFIRVRGTVDEHRGLIEIDQIFEYEILAGSQPLPDPEVFEEHKLAQHISFNCLKDNSYEQGAIWEAGSGSGSLSWNVYSIESWVPEDSPVSGKVKESEYVSASGIVYSDDDGYHFLMQSVDYAVVEPCLFWEQIPCLTNAGFDFLAFELSVTKSATARAILKSMKDGTDTIYFREDTAFNILIDRLEPASFYQVSWEVYNEADTLRQPFRWFITQSLSSKDIEVFFNNHVQYEVETGYRYFTRGIDLVNEIVERINNARESIDICLYNFNNDDIKSALEDAQDRGIRVRCIADGDNSNVGFRNTDLNVFRTAYGSPLMHNKFIIVDANIAENAWLFMGATNLTPGQIFNDPNSALGIEDQMLARVYEREFEELWGSTGPEYDPVNDRHGSDKVNNTPHQMYLGTSYVSSYFSPSDGTTQAIVDALSTAREEVYFSLLTFTKNEIRDILIELHDRGVEVKGIIENVDDTGGEFYKLNAEGIEVLDDTKGRIHHHKYAIIDPHSPDNAKLIVGSHNWTQKAEDTNDENTLIFHNASLAQIFLSEFYGRWCEYRPENVNCEADTITPSEQINLVLSPNPTTSAEVNIFLNSENSLVFDIIVYDVQGRMIREFSRGLQPGSNYLYEMNGLVPGLYIIKAIHGDEQYKLRSIIVE